MRTHARLPALLAGTLLVSAVLATKPAAVLAAARTALCAVCSVREGAGPEEARATARSEGKEYAFCSDNCKQEFLADPKAFLTAQAPRPAEGAEGHQHEAPRPGSTAPS